MMMGKFKVGDRVKRVKKSRLESFGFAPIGTVGVVTEVSHDGSIKLDTNSMFNKPDHFELVCSFTKSDLKDGMRVEFRGGFQSGLLFEFFLSKHIGNIKPRCHLREIEEDLSHFQQREFDIMKVTDRDGTVLFEREEKPRELTIEEIAEAFNLPVERVRIKK